MAREFLDSFLSGEEEIVPSLGFAQAVMERVRHEAFAPTPIPFPWLRALPGLMLITLLLLALIFVPMPTSSSGNSGVFVRQVSAILRLSGEAMSSLGVYWLVGALLAAWASVKVSMRVVSWRTDWTSRLVRAPHPNR